MKLTSTQPDIGVRVSLDTTDINELKNGRRLTKCKGCVDLTLEKINESPLEYLERTWNEPRYGETPRQHFNRIHGVSE